MIRVGEFEVAFGEFAKKTHLCSLQIRLKWVHSSSFILKTPRITVFSTFTLDIAYSPC